MKKYASTIRIALLTALAIILFQVISLLTVYQYVRVDLYLTLVAGCFLAMGWLIARRPSGAPAPKLTQRELQILRLIAEGKTNKEIARAYFVEVSTVKTHVNNIYAKLAVSNRAQAGVKYAELTGSRPV